MDEDSPRADDKNLFRQCLLTNVVEITYIKREMNSSLVKAIP